MYLERKMPDWVWSLSNGVLLKIAPAIVPQSGVLLLRRSWLRGC